MQPDVIFRACLITAGHETKTLRAFNLEVGSGHWEISDLEYSRWNKAHYSSNVQAYATEVLYMLGYR